MKKHYFNIMPYFIVMRNQLFSACVRFYGPILLRNSPSRLFFRLKMAEYTNLVRRALGQLGGHGGVRGFLLQLFRSV